MSQVNNGEFRGEHPPEPGFRPEHYGLSKSDVKELATSTAPLQLETRCGTKPVSQHVEQYNGQMGVSQQFVHNHESPVGQIRWNSNVNAMFNNPGNVSGANWCSGTLIANDLFLTAGHCFDAVDTGDFVLPRSNGTDKIIPPESIAQNMSVSFSFQLDNSGAPRREQTVAVSELVEHRTGNLDYAIVRLAGNPSVNWGTTTLSGVGPRIGDMLTIIGHPAGQRKQVEAGPLTAATQLRLRYNDNATLGGNSGAGILHIASNSIVGIHTNEGCTGNSPETGFNVGHSMTALLRVSPTLYNIYSGTDGPSTKMVSWQPNRLDTFARGTDGTLRHWWCDGGNWGSESLSGSIIGAPAVCSWQPDRLDTFARGTDSTLHHWFWDGSKWGNESLGGSIVGAPTVCSWQPNRLDAFARGTDDTLRHWWWDGNNWGNESLRGSIAGTPVVCSWQPNRLDAFARGTDGSLRHWFWDGTNWGSESLGGSIAGAPTVCARQPNRLDILARGNDNELHHWRWDGNRWESESLGGSIAGTPAICSWQPNRLDGFARGTDGTLRHWWWSGKDWGSESLGGCIIGAPTVCAWQPNRLDCCTLLVNGNLAYWRWDGNNWAGPISLGGDLC